MPKEIRYFACSRCKNTFTNIKEAYKCEASHPEVNGVEAIISKGRIYPDHLMVTFDTGKKIIYTIGGR